MGDMNVEEGPVEEGDKGSESVGDGLKTPGNRVKMVERTGNLKIKIIICLLRTISWSISIEL